MRSGGIGRVGADKAGRVVTGTKRNIVGKNIAYQSGDKDLLPS